MICQWWCNLKIFVQEYKPKTLIPGLFSSLVLLSPLWVSPSVQFSRSVVLDSWRPHGLQHARPPCPLPTPWVYSNSCPLSWWCHPTISCSVASFSFRLQFFSASGSFPMSQFFLSGGRSIGASASASVLPMNIQGWFPLGWTGLISLQFKGLAQESFLALQFESINALALSFMIQLSHLYTTTEKAIALTVWIFAGKVMSLLFNTLSRLVIAFLPRSKHLWFCGCSHRPQWFWSPRK